MTVFLIQTAIFMLMFGMLALSYNLLFGYRGVTSLAHAGFWGIGAYASALTLTKLSLPWPVGMALGIVIAVIIGAAVAIPAARLRGDYLLVATVGFQVIIHGILLNWRGLTNGPLGITAIPRPTVGSIAIVSPLNYLFFSAVLFGIVFILTWRLSESPFGRMLKAVRDDDLAAQSCGKNAVHTTVLAFAISGGIAAIAGSFIAGWVTYIDPEGFVLLNSLLVLTIVAVGGAGNFFGAIVGTVVIVGMPELLRLLELPGGLVGPLRQIIVGLILVLFMIFRPQGIVPEHRSQRAPAPPPSDDRLVVETTA